VKTNIRVLDEPHEVFGIVEAIHNVVCHIAVPKVILYLKQRPPVCCAGRGQELVEHVLKNVRIELTKCTLAKQ